MVNKLHKVFQVDPECDQADLSLMLEDMLLQLEALGRARALEAEATEDEEWIWGLVRDRAAQARLLAEELVIRREAEAKERGNK